MNREEYTEYFNLTQPPGSRKISPKILELYEQKTEYAGNYYRHTKTLEDIRNFLITIPSNLYLKLTGEKQKRHREPSLLKNTTLEIKAFPIDEELNHRWQFLADDLENKQKYCWDKSKQYTDQRKKQNQIYFNPADLIDEFLALDLKEFPLTYEKKQKIIEFVGKYGPYFIRYYEYESKTSRDREWYFWHFWMDFIHFKKCYEITKKGKPLKFPHARTPSRILGQLYNRTNEDVYMNWQENIGEAQLWFNMCRTVGQFPILGKSPHDIHEMGRGIGIICNYIYQQCDKLIQCQYQPCGKWFFQSSKNQTACCPRHSLLNRIKKYKKKIRQ